MQNLSIKKLMLAAIITTSIILSVFVILTTTVFTDINAKTREQQRLANAELALEETRYHVVQIQQFLTDVSATANTDGFQDAKDELTSALYSLDKLVKYFPEWGNQAATFKEQIDKLHTVGTNMANVYIKDGRDAGNAIMQTPEAGFDAISTQISTGIESLVNKLETKLNSASKALDDSEQNGKYIVTVFSLIILVTAVIALFLLYSKTVPPLRSLLESLHDINRGTGNLTKRLPHASDDEVGVIVDEFNQFIEKLQAIVRDIVQSSIQFSTAAETMATVTEQTTQGVLQQQSETDQVATAMNEMSATVHEVARNAAQAAEAAKLADEEGMNGKKVVNQTISSIDQLAQDVEKAAEVIHLLEDDSKNIGVVLDVIRGIAEQTNLLALNAAIEAARAGEQGRGFAVVADEVRTLASRTQESTQEIRQMIESLQSGANNAVQVMTQGRKQAQLSVEQAAQAGTSLEAIAKAIATINDMNTQIASAAEEQSAVSDEINRNIVNISQVATQTSQGAQQTAQQGEQLALESKQLQRLVNQFTV